ncbi:MAG: hypothetical protein IKK93_00620 [Campylobacter sp.]|nr:hypothetical protein [Campylobacter sp.]
MRVTFSFEPDEEKQIQAFFENNYRKCCDPFSVENGFSDCKFGVILENCIVQGLGIDRRFDAFDWRPFHKQGLHNNEYDLYIESFKIVN